MQLKISANKLAEFITARTPQKRARIVQDMQRELKQRALKEEDKGYAPYYMSFGSPAKRYLVAGNLDSSEIKAVIEKLRVREGSGWHAIDYRVTKDAFQKLIKIGPYMKALPVKFKISPAQFKTGLQVDNVSVNTTPDLLVEGKRNGVPLAGSLRFFTSKESGAAGARRAELVSSMQYQALVRAARGGAAPDTTLCMVLECFQERLTLAKHDAPSDLAAIEKGCRDFEALWHLIASQDAA